MRVRKDRFRRARQPEKAGGLKPIFDDFHLLRMEGNYEYPAHRHASYELILVESGPYRCRLNDAELRLENGEILVIKPNDWHQDHLRDGQRHYVVHFRLLDADGTSGAPLFADGISPDSQISRGKHGREAKLIRELQYETEADLPYAPAVQDCILEALFWRAVRGLPAEVLSPAVRRIPKHEAIRARVVAAMTRRLNSNPSMTEIAGDLRMSPRQLAVVCRDLFGHSPARLFLRMKLRQAEERLRYGDRLVKEVSEELGFVNPYHFSRVFRRVYGRPPSRS